MAALSRYSLKESSNTFWRPPNRILKGNDWAYRWIIQLISALASPNAGGFPNPMKAIRRFVSALLAEQPPRVNFDCELNMEPNVLH